jgi:ABC-2 type transport system ATP-binding protein
VIADAVRFTAVEKRFGSATALAGLTFHVAKGEMFGLIGPDGAGKTTAIRLLCGLLHPDAGSVRVLGADPAKEHAVVTARVGYLSQRFTLYGDLTIDENIEFFAEIHGVRDFRPRREQLLEMTRLTPFRARLADRLSGGMKQKLALACTLVHEPELLLLDEPLANLDPGGALAVAPLIGRQAGPARVLISHDVEQGLGEADWVLGLRGGRQAFFAAAAEVGVKDVRGLYA